MACWYDGRGKFTVSIGSEPGKVYTVQAPRGSTNPSQWTCDRPWGQNGGSQCSHVRAAHAWLEREMVRKGAADMMDNALGSEGAEKT